MPASVFSCTRNDNIKKSVIADISLASVRTRHVLFLTLRKFVSFLLSRKFINWAKDLIIRPLQLNYLWKIAWVLF